VIPVFTVNLLPDPKALEDKNLTVVQAVQTDQKAGGKYIGEQLLKDLGPNGSATVGIVGEPTAVAANMRDAGFKEAVAANPTVKVVALVNGKVEETTSLKVTTEMLQGNPQIDVVYSDTEPAALGALAAIKQLGRNDVKLYAFVDKIGVKHIAENTYLKAGAIQEPAKLAQIQIANIKKFLAGDKLEPLVDSPPLLVDKSNAAGTVERLIEIEPCRNWAATEQPESPNRFPACASSTGSTFKCGRAPSTACSDTTAPASRHC